MRSLWIGTLAAALSCSAPGWSQMLQPDRWIMVREEGKPAVKCRVVSTKKQKDGTTLCQAKTEAGETLTLLEEPVKGMPSGTMRMRVMPGTSNCTTCGPLPGVPQPPPAITPMPTSTPPALKPVPPPTIMPAVVQAKPEVKKERTSLIGRFFPSTPSKPEVEKKDLVVKAASEARPQLPISTTSTDDPLSRPDLFTKSGVSSLPNAVPPVTTPATLIGRVFNRSETPVVTTSVETKVGTMPAPVVVEGEPRPGIFAWMQGSSPPKVTVVQESKEITPSLLDRLRAQMATAPTPPTPKPAAIPANPRRIFPMGQGSVVAARDRAIMGQSAGGAMVRTPTGAMAYLTPDEAPQGPNVVPVSASNAFTLSMPGARPGMMGSMPMVAMQPQATYDRGVPEGVANAFTMTSSTRPIPADFGPPPQVPNAFLIDGMGGAYTRPMALAYDPRMGYVPVGGGYPQQLPMLPMPHPAGQMLATLRGSILPSERERAVMMLSRCNWHAEPEAVAAIMIAAKVDPAPAVRISCVRALARMKVNTMPAYETLQELKTDKDVRVRQEAEQTLATMTRH
jgi:HEAT repeats